MTKEQFKELVEHLDTMAAALAYETVKIGMTYSLTGKSLTPREEELAHAIEASTKTTVFRTLYVLAKSFLPEDEQEPGLSDEIFELVYSAKDEPEAAEPTEETQGVDLAGLLDGLEGARQASNEPAPNTGLYL